jgi:hypothetical protein
MAPTALSTAPSLFRDAAAHRDLCRWPVVAHRVHIPTAGLIAAARDAFSTSAAIQFGFGGCNSRRKVTVAFAGTAISSPSLLTAISC